MKKYRFIFILFCFICFEVNAQENKTEYKSSIVLNEISKSKTANWKDVITDFMQFAVKDLSGDKKSFQYKTTIFSLKSKVDTTLLFDYNFAKAKFSRNFQVSVGVDLDKDFKYQSFSYGADWAIINKRDLTVNTLVDKTSSDLFGKYFEITDYAINEYEAFLDNEKDPEKTKKIKIIYKIFEDNQDKPMIPKALFPEDFRVFLPSDYDNLLMKFKNTFKKELDSIKMQPLLTIGFHSTLNKQPKLLDTFDATIVYLKGLKSHKGKLEIDFRNKFSANDSITTSIVKRREFSSQLGLNIGLTGKDDTSFIELKPSFEYKRILSGLMNDEKNNQFLANADLRIRVLENLWIPLILKYDIDNNNLFGFLNISFNFNAVKNE